MAARHRPLMVLLAALLAVGVALYARHRRGERPPEAAGGVAAAGKPEAAGAAPAAEVKPGAEAAQPPPASQRPSRISGVVLHDDGTPAEGWRVCLSLELRPDAMPDAFTFDRDTRTAKDGSFAFGEILFGGKLEVAAKTCDRKTDPRWAWTLDPGEDRKDLVLRLPPMTSLVVTVVDPRGAVVEGSAVTIWNAQRLGVVVTGADGTARFELNGLAEAAARAEPPASGARRFIATWAHEFPVSRGAVRIVLEEAGVARGLVLTPEGAPAAGVVILVKREGPVISTSTSGADGRFECAVPLDKPVDLLVEPYCDKAPMLFRADGTLHRVKGALGRVSAGDTGLQMKLEWVEEATLVVVVLSPDGEPVAGATAYAYEQQVGNTRSAVSGADGHATFEGLPRVPFSITVEPPETPEAADWMLGQGSPGGVEPGDEPEEVELPRGCRVKGLILRPDGSPAAGSRLKLNQDAVFCCPWPPRDGYEAGPDGRFSFLISPGVAQDLQLLASVEADRLHGDRKIDARDLKEDVIVQLVRDP